VVQALFTFELFYALLCASARTPSLAFSRISIPES
jgi:hypothetical protein